MVDVIDRTCDDNDKSLDNRDRYIQRRREEIQEQVEGILEDSSIEDRPDKHKISIDPDGEDWFQYSEENDYSRVLPGNRDFVRGDVGSIPHEGGRGSGGMGGGESEDDFYFYITNEEFLDILFDGLRLPNLVKEGLGQIYKEERIRAGYSKTGPFSKLDLKKSMEMALMRRFAQKKSKRKVPFLDDDDLRFKAHAVRRRPSRFAVMILCMDVSGSMDEDKKLFAKKFFLLMHRFISRQYDGVDVRFIKYHHRAEECDENTFFYSRETGGTSLFSALTVADKIIAEYDNKTTNLYLVNAGDGDVGFEVRESAELLSKLVDLCQYTVSLEIDTYSQPEMGELELLMQYDESKFVRVTCGSNTNITWPIREAFGGRDA